MVSHIKYCMASATVATVTDRIDDAQWCGLIGCMETLGIDGGSRFYREKSDI